MAKSASEILKKTKSPEKKDDKDNKKSDDKGNKTNALLNFIAANKKG